MATSATTASKNPLSPFALYSRKTKSGNGKKRPIRWGLQTMASTEVNRGSAEAQSRRELVLLVVRKKHGRWSQKRWDFVAHDVVGAMHFDDLRSK